MKIRKLDQREHGKTRKLWENVFPEDTKAFLDYYYFFKTRDNEIYVAEENEGVCSMLHLNPYLIQVEGEQFLLHYIIAVATEPKYRGRGYMRALLVHAMQEMYRRGEPFTYLVPAAEAIYTPYDFRFIYDQTGYELSENLPQEAADFLQCHAFAGTQGIESRDASMGDAGRIADFFNIHLAEEKQVFAVRDEQYYQAMLLERQSENGGIRLLEKEGTLVGTFAYCNEDGLEIQEPVFAAGYDGLFIREAGKKPTVMARILRPEKLMRAMKVKPGESVDCSFAVLDSILPQNSRIWRIQGGGEGEDGRLHVRETEDSEGVLTIAALTSLLFGYRTVEETAKEADVLLSAHLQTELQKIRPLRNVYLNEFV